MKKYLVLILIAVGSFATSCSSWIDPALNVDPNNPSDAPPSYLLPSVEVQLAYTNGSTLSRMSNLLTQQYEGTDRQHLGFYNYLITSNDIIDIWDNIYSPTLINAQILIQKSTRVEFVGFRAAGRILTAAAIGAATDAFGDVPFSEALLGSESGGKFNAKFDKQADIYTRIQLLLDSAITELATAKAFTNDYIYGGDPKKWTKAAWALKARYAIHLTKRNGNAAATQALQFLAKGFQSNSDDFTYNFDASASQSNPLWQFMDGRTGDMAFGSVFQKRLTALKDPRLGPYADDTNADYPGFGTFYFSQNSPIVLMSYAEQKFIEAEANQRLGNAAAALSAYKDGVSSSMKFIGVAQADADAYLAQSSVTPTGALTIERIIEQKYIALFTQPETWTDWRRTGFPVLTPVKGSAIPRRLPVSFDETQYNAANIPAGSLNTVTWIYTPVWWDGN